MTLQIIAELKVVLEPEECLRVVKSIPIRSAFEVKAPAGRNDARCLQSSDVAAEELQRRRKAFIDKYRITERELLVLQELAKGTRLKQFADAIGLGFSNTRRIIEKLCKRLDLESREQLLYVAGVMQLADFNPACLSNNGGDNCVR